MISMCICASEAGCFIIPSPSFGNTFSVIASVILIQNDVFFEFLIEGIK